MITSLVTFHRFMGRDDVGIMSKYGLFQHRFQRCQSVPLGRGGGKSGWAGRPAVSGNLLEVGTFHALALDGQPQATVTLFLLMNLSQAVEDPRGVSWKPLAAGFEGSIY